MTGTGRDDGLDLSRCDREPIHIPGSIQPHGVLLALSASHLVTAVSDNLLAHCGIAAADLLGTAVAGWLGADAIAALASAIEMGGATAPVVITTPGNGGVAASRWNALVHRCGDQTLVELEPVTDDDDDARYRDLFGQLQAALTGLGADGDGEALCGTAAAAVRDVTGFDRVMIYRFEADWHGVVVGEARRADIAPLLGLHFPASDIPAQARRLYQSSPLRMIAAVDYQPSALVSADAEPLDLSASVLRSVSPVHLAYLRNMDVAASMSVSILGPGGVLWGLIACHHQQPRLVAQPLRRACQMIGQLLAQRLTAVAERDQAERRSQRAAVLARILARAAHTVDAADALLAGAATMLDVADASGAAVCLDDRIESIGAAPPAAAIRVLASWLDGRTADVWSTTTLAAELPAMAEHRDLACGLLAVRLVPGQPSFLLWFRPEVIATIAWAGDPTKPASADGDRIEPRRSFAQWQQTVAGRSLDWQADELDAGRGLVRAFLVCEVGRRRRELEHANDALAISNHELDSFAHSVSHDLKEPLRGIRHHLRFLREDHGAALGDDGSQRMDAMDALAVRMRSLLDVVLELSRLGRTELDLADVDLGAAVAAVGELLTARLAETGGEIRVPAALPTVRGDGTLLRQLLMNLIGNGLTYNRSTPPWVEVTASAGPPVTLHVRDNGIGIPAGRERDVFVLFRRLHGGGGDGNGAGLALVARIAARHHGRVWVEPASGGGSTFHVALGTGSGGGGS